MSKPDPHLSKRPDGGQAPIQNAEEVTQLEQAEFEKLSRANQASALLDNPMFDEAFDAVREELIDSMMTSTNISEGDTKRSLQLLALVKNLLTEHISTGKLAKHALNELRQKREYFGRRTG